MVRQTNAGGTIADLVVFMTDGDPTARNRPGQTAQTNLPDGSVEALRPAWQEANLVKGQGSHVFAVGVGPAVSLATSRRRLAADSNA